MKNPLRKLTVSIGIPVFNEEANIKELMKRLLAQKQENFSLLEIIVVSDGSTDRTEEIVESLHHPKITLIKKKKRTGQQMCQNLILRLFKGDILVFIEGDTIPADSSTIAELINPYLKRMDSKLGMVVGNAKNIESQTFFEKITSYGGMVKGLIFEEWNGGNNIYATGGHSMKALSRIFTHKLVYPYDVPEDSYTYLRLKELKLDMVIQKNAQTYMKDVAKYKDSLTQFTKFSSGIASLKKYFPPDFVDSECNPPIKLLLKHILLSSIKNPVMTLSYLAVASLNRINTLNKKTFDPLYAPYQTTKNLSGGSGGQYREKNEFKKAFNEIADEYDYQAIRYSKGLIYQSLFEINFIQKHLTANKNNKQTFLDLGVGTGRNAEILLKNNCMVTGLDFSKAMILRAKEKLKKYTIRNELKLIIHDLNHSLPFPNNSFDGAICIRVIKYVHKWKDLLKDTARVLKPNGDFIVEFPNFFSVQNLSHWYEGYKVFKPQEVEQILKKVGLKIIDKESGMMLPFFIYKNTNSEQVLQILSFIERFLKKITGNTLVKNYLYYCRKEK